MSNQWLITIGINQYQHFQPLNYAQADAQGLWNLVVSRGSFLPDRCLLLTDTSPFIEGQSTYPSGTNLKQWLDHLCQQAIKEDDLVWFFFSGYGVKWEGQDYLMPIDGNPADVNATGISVKEIYEKLKGSKAGTVLVLLDMNHQQEYQDGSTVVGNQTVELAREMEIPTVLSCQPGQFSYEVGELQHGLFSAALLEGLRSGAGLTLANLKRYLSERVPESSQNHSRPLQEPVFVVNPPGKSHQVILPEQPVFVGSSNGEWSPVTAQLVGSGASVTSAVATSSAENPFQAALRNQQEAGATPTASTNNGQPKPVNVAGEDDDEDNGSLWQQILLWGGGLLLLLLLILTTFGRNFLFPAGEQAEGPGDSITGTVTSPDRLTALDKAKVGLRNNQANSYVEAIKQVSQIKSGDPLYREAQTAMERWSRNILDIAQGRANTGNYRGAIAAASLVPQDPQPVFTDAERLIRQWTPLAKKQQANQAVLSTAKGLIRPNSASSYIQAINMARKIPQGDPGYAQAQALINQWSQSILNLAKQRANQGNFVLAIQAANLVPADTPAYKEAQQAIAQWQNR
ncbi:caspase domain-containing protein [Aerosakkonemataceae cyanobacterium BLCC-F154]|uniref:Caspase domain-containing protein n=1 Tax=Floridaenema fluviatile BLCC-F154 TaxID=3153640 RepID=A0ABV4Y6G2_9CYAN